MGSASSIVVAERRLGEGNEKDEQERKPKKSVRDRFSKEFGTSEVVRKTTLGGNVDKKPSIVKENIGKLNPAPMSCIFYRRRLVRVTSDFTV